MKTRPNVLFIFADQWRHEAAGFAGNAQVHTPAMDSFAREGLQFGHAISGCPVCSPYRASLLTGQYPTTHGVIVNDQAVTGEAIPLAEAFRRGGYDTAYIGKWHLTLHDRCRPIEKHERLGFELWRGFGCSHRYNRSPYYADDDPHPRWWDGYDAHAQTREACRYIASRRGGDRPFLMVLSWGPPHDPYETAPEEFQRMYRPADIVLRPNVPEDAGERAGQELAGYYAHVSALDAAFADLLRMLRDSGLERDTLVVLTSDHGDMLGSHGLWRKQHPYEESIHVPWLMRWPGGLSPGRFDVPIGAVDIMPTLLGLCGQPVPSTVEGQDFSPAILGDRPVETEGVLLACYRPFHEITYATGGRDYRGLRTPRYTYCRDLQGPWLLFDNQADPLQINNRAADPACRAVRDELDAALTRRLRRISDSFEPGPVLLRKFNIRLSEKTGDVYVL